MIRIDAHQHFWEYDPQKHSWINDEMAVLKRDFMPDDLRLKLELTGMDGCVAVQADQQEAETTFLLDLADQYDFIRGVVGWLDICADNFREQLARYAAHPRLKGLRHLVQDEEDDRFLLRDDFLAGMEALGDVDLAYDILIFPRHLPAAVAFANRFPDQVFVLDHIAKPYIKDQKTGRWEEGIRALAEHPKMYCKLSGMVTEADWQGWTADDFKPYLDIVFEAFGPGRLMFGSDWPVCTLAASYEEVYRLVAEYISSFSEEEQQQIWGGNARRCYNL